MIMNSPYESLFRRNRGFESFEKKANLFMLEDTEVAVGCGDFDVDADADVDDEDVVGKLLLLVVLVVLLVFAFSFNGGFTSSKR